MCEKENFRVADVQMGEFINIDLKEIGCNAGNLIDLAKERNII